MRRGEAVGVGIVLAAKDAKSAKGVVEGRRNWEGIPRRPKGGVAEGKTRSLGDGAPKAGRGAGLLAERQGLFYLSLKCGGL